ncbi:MAG: beta-lactamase family protein [Myxococcales bacterium]|nr:beta-lactamase family protein [Myxococcales bacterium]
MAEALRLPHLLRQGVAQHVAPAIAFGIATADGQRGTWFAGHHGPDRTGRPCDALSRFDLASLTKPLSTTAWCMRLVDAGRLALDQPIGDHLPVDDAALAGCPLWRLLSHTTGLPAHRRYYEGLGPTVLRTGRFAQAERALRRMLAATPTEVAPGRREIYSDLGFLLLAWICERADAPLASIWRTLPGHDAPERGLHFRPLPAPGDDRDLYVPTERCPWRGRLLQGEVHDDNAWTLGGVAGHAGLFGTLDATLDTALRWLRALQGDDAALGLPAEAVTTWCDRRWMHPHGTRVLGWDTPTPGASTSGAHFGRRSIGHLGFTGTSLWIDPAAGVAMVLLTNRVCPSRDSAGIRAYRPALHDAGWAWLRARSPERFT